MELCDFTRECMTLLHPLLSFHTYRLMISPNGPQHAGYTKMRSCVGRSLNAYLIRKHARSPLALEQLTKLRGLSPHANYTDRAAAAGRRS